MAKSLDDIHQIFTDMEERTAQAERDLLFLNSSLKDMNPCREI